MMDITQVNYSLNDVEHFAMTNTASQIKNEINVQLLSNSIDQIKTQGTDMIRMMELSVNPNIGSNVDVFI
ncbi:YjfB family protein [Lachnobacterium bovis]|uniref:Putative motility protein n=1 Tax=Lachnobacterium bovis DSM 14045 TaxID=1122142 RepID=A0A1H3I0K2_9FIRM|nr:YjfB family protein [Lachnobacterium bovis]MBQ1801715.1 YjfB family protein [Lachnobacterium sp.]SDY20574.1 Putative motility protein [Lachnobacterium bovis DSM 14045]